MPKQESKRSEKPSEVPGQNLPASKRKTKRSEKSAEDASPLISATHSRAANNEEGGNPALGNIYNHRKKRSKEEKELHAITQLEPSENTSKASKKRKRKDAENGPSQSKANGDDEDIVANEPQRKKRNRTEFADPREDQSLGSQCRKGEHNILDERDNLISQVISFGICFHSNEQTVQMEIQ